MGPERGKDSRSRKSKGMSRGKASDLKKTRKERLGKTRTQNEGLWIYFPRTTIVYMCVLAGQKVS